MRNKRINKMVATQQQCEALIDMGITATPVLFYHKRSGLYHASPDNYLDADFVENYEDQVVARTESVPAYTKAELDAMIGPNLPKPDLWTDKEFLNSGKNIEDEEVEENFKKKRAQERESYPVFYPEKLLVYKNGAEASAEVLLFLLKNDHIKPKDANARHKKIFAL